MPERAKKSPSYPGERRNAARQPLPTATKWEQNPAKATGYRLPLYQRAVTEGRLLRRLGFADKATHLVATQAMALAQFRAPV